MQCIRFTNLVTLLFCAIMITQEPGYSLNKIDIPTNAPKDAVMADSKEINGVMNWSAAAFAGIDKHNIRNVDVELRRQDYGELQFNKSFAGTPIKIGTQEFKHGLGTHANSEIAITLPQGAKAFRSYVGIDNNSQTNGSGGSVQFSIEVGGKEVFRTPTLKGSDAAVPVNIAIPANSDQMLLKVDTTADGPIFDHADWADANIIMNDGRVIWLDESPSRQLSLLSNTALPFSFICDNISSTDLLKTWKRVIDTKDEHDRIIYNISWTDPKTGLVVSAVVTSFKEYPAVDWVLYFENAGTQDTPIIENVQTADMNLATSGVAPAILHQIHGDSCSDMSYLPFDTKLETGKSISMAPLGGRSSSMTFPFWNLQYGDQGVITAIGWSGQWAASYDRLGGNVTRFQAGMERTHFILHPGERVRCPRILMMSWSGNLRDAQNRFRRLMLYKYVPRLNNKPLQLPVALQTFDRYSGKPDWATEAGQLDAIKNANEIGCDSYWFDAGWFEGGFPAGGGNWYPDPVRFPNGLKPLGDACHKNGMQFILWFEPIRANAGTMVTREHPEWVYGGKNGGMFNFSIPEARQWMTDLSSKIISESGVDVYREDYGMYPLDYWKPNDAPDRQGINEMKFIEGIYTMWDELRAKHPGLWIDNCGSGGGRIDLETCMRSVPLWRSDTCCGSVHSDWNQMQSITLSQYVPLNTSAAWDPDFYTVRSSATAGVLCQVAYRDPAFPKAVMRKALDEVKQNRKYWYGDIYPLVAPASSKDQFFAYQLHRADLNEGMIMAFRREDCSILGLTVAPNAINPNVKYELEFVSESGKKATKKVVGKQLIESGLQLYIPQKASSLLIRYKPAAK